jgi:putative transposase
VSQLRQKGLSLRRSCALCRISRSSYGYESYESSLERVQQDRDLSQRLHHIAKRRPRYGYRRAHALLRREGHLINQKRVRRLWKQEKLTLPQRRPRRRRAAKPEKWLYAAARPHHVWTYDFVQDKCNQGHRLRFLTITDEFTRQSLAVVTATSIRSAQVLEVLSRLFVQHGAPQYLRSDNGPEFVSQAVQQWLREQGVQTVYIEPGCPWQNGYAESFHSRFRDECLNREWFHNVREARVVVEAWRKYYNQQRPHSSLNYLTPVEFAARWQKQQEPQHTPAMAH